MHPHLPFFTRNAYVWLAGVGIIGTAYQLAMIVMWLNFPGVIWCLGLAATAIFATMAAVGVWKAERFKWWYVIPMVVIGVALTGGQAFSIGPFCFGSPTMMSWNSI